MELVNKPTTNTWMEEKQVLRQYKMISIKICAILHILKLHKLRNKVLKADHVADDIAKQAIFLNNRIMCT